MIGDIKRKKLMPGLLIYSFVVYAIYLVLIIAGMKTGIIVTIKHWEIPVLLLLPIPFLLYPALDYRIKLGKLHLFYPAASLLSGIILLLLLHKNIPTMYWLLGSSMYAGIIGIPLVSRRVSSFLKKLNIEEYQNISEEFSDTFSLTIGLCVSGTILSGILLLIATFFANSSGRIYILVSVMSFILGIISAYAIVMKVKTTTGAVSKGFIEVSRGNYGFTLDCNSADECGKFFLTFNIMTKKISDTINTLKKTGITLGKALKEISTLFFKDVDEVNNGIAYLNETLKNMELIKEMLENLAEAGSGVYKKNEENYSKILTTINTLKSLTEFIKSLEIHMASIGETSKIFDTLRRKISAIVKSLREISSQIQILAVNAEIEASDAGEYGRRFMVIAEEIRRLAEKSSSITSGVEESMDVIVGRIDNLKSSIKRVEEMLKKNEGKIKEAGEITDSSLASLESIKEGIEEIFNTIEEMKESSDKLQNSMNLGNQVLVNVGEKLLSLQNSVKEMENILKEIENNGRLERDIQE